LKKFGKEIALVERKDRESGEKASSPVILSEAKHLYLKDFSAK
jgi:hypothetical protein